MRTNDAVYKGKTRDGRDFVLRYPNKNDAEKMLNFINIISKEKTFIRYQGETVGQEEENSYLKSRLDQINNNKAVMLLVEVDGKIMGNSSIEMRDKAERHIGEFAISILEEIRGQGIGKLLMDQVIVEAKKRLAGLEIITLSVFANNTKAANMYRKFGFVEYGNLKGGILYRGKPVDHIYMYRSVI